jgi:hypothetical protein
MPRILTIGDVCFVVVNVINQVYNMITESPGNVLEMSLHTSNCPLTLACNFRS